MGQSLGPWAHTTNVALSLSTTFLICITLLFGTETPGPRCQKEISLNQISIASKIWITWMMLMNWRLNFGLAGITMLIGLPRRVLSILDKLLYYLSAFCCSRWAFSQVLATFLSEHKQCPNTGRKLLTINMTGIFTILLVMCCVWMAVSWTTVPVENLQLLLPTHEGRSWVLPSRVCLELYSMC